MSRSSMPSRLRMNSSRWEQWFEDSNMKGKYSNSGLDVGSLMDLQWHIGDCSECGRIDVQVVIMHLYEPNRFLLRRFDPIEVIGPMCVKCHDWSKSRVVHPAFERPEAKYRKGQLHRAIANGLVFEPQEDFGTLQEAPLPSKYNHWEPKKFLADAWDICQKQKEQQ